MNRLVGKTLICVVAALLLAGCGTFDMVSNLFDTGTRKSNLKGERISVMSMDESLKPDPTLAQTPVKLPAPYVNAEWSQPGGYAANAMYHLEASGPLQQVWNQEAGKGSDNDSRLTAPPIVADGRVYVLDSAAHVYVYDASGGKPLWDKNLAPQEGDTDFMADVTFGLAGKDTTIDPSKGFGGGLAFDDGKLFVSTGFGSVFALNAGNGKLLWKKDLGVPIVNAPVANGGRVFISTQENHFFALAQDDGRQLWDHQGISESAGILESTSAAVAGEYVLVPYSSGELFAIRVQNGRPAWNDTLTRSGGVTALSELDDIAGRPVVDRDMVFAISHSGLMVAISLSTGDRIWSRDIGGIQTPWAAGDYVYVLTTDAQLLCFARADGRVKWVHQLQRYDDPETRDGPIIWSGPILVSDRLILVSSNGYAVSVSPYTGELMGRVEIPDGTYIPPVVANGTLYLLTNSAELVAMR
ncbi:MAG: PQQ-binding-like beta-propeller repeat protein [Proteobacteria bacterium]|nr:PQQ-binding-like beta-propeller repeat protein [Pseudomonadota bacterium]